VGASGSGGGHLPGQRDGVEWGQSAHGLGRDAASAAGFGADDVSPTEADPLDAHAHDEDLQDVAQRASQAGESHASDAAGGLGTGSGAGTGSGSDADSDSGSGTGSGEAPIFATDEDSVGSGGGLGLGDGGNAGAGGGSAGVGLGGGTQRSGDSMAASGQGGAGKTQAADSGATLPEGASGLATGDSKLGAADQFWQTEEGMDSLRNRIQRLGRFRQAWQSLEKRKVLVAEEDADVREYFKTIFERAGFEVEIALNGDEALQLFFMHDIKLLVVDFHLDRKDGMEVAKEALEVSKVPVIFTTKMEHDAQILNDLKRYGVEWVLKKPFSNDTVKPVLKEAIGAALLQDNDETK
jgi:CheY-like chemotaxis protein